MDNRYTIGTGRAGWHANSRRISKSQREKIALVAPLFLIGSTYAVFQWLAALFGETWGWYLGLVTYWLAWGAAFPVWLVGWERLLPLIRPQRIDRKAALLLLVPLAGAAAYKLVPGMNYHQSEPWLLLMMVSTAFGNGFFEEVLWRGVYMTLFPNKLVWRIFWPTIAFALWHFVPGTISPNGDALALVIGSGVFGFYLSFLARQTGAIWWGIVAHVVGGLIMVS